MEIIALLNNSVKRFHAMNCSQKLARIVNPICVKKPGGARLSHFGNDNALCIGFTRGWRGDLFRAIHQLDQSHGRVITFAEAKF